MKPKTIKLKRGDSDVVRLLKMYQKVLFHLSEGTDISAAGKENQENAWRMVLEIKEIIKKIGD